MAKRKRKGRGLGAWDVPTRYNPDTDDYEPDFTTDYDEDFPTDWDRTVEALVAKRGPKCKNYDKIANAYKACKKQASCPNRIERRLAAALARAYAGSCKKAERGYKRAQTWRRHPFLAGAKAKKR